MKVETLIYAYLAVCVSMILFNIVCIFIFRKKDKNIKKRSIDFTDIIKAQLDEQTVDEKHKNFLRKKLKKINHMMAFDETLEKPKIVQSGIAFLVKGGDECREIQRARAKTAIHSRYNEAVLESPEQELPDG